MATLEKHFSKERLSPYVASGGGYADLLYFQNLKISEAFYPLISVFEVAFRNRINAVLTNGFNDSNWIINQASRNGYMSNKKLADPHYPNDPNKGYFQRKKVNAVQYKSPGKIIATMTLGFWVEFFSPTTYGLVQKYSKKVNKKIDMEEVFNTHSINKPKKKPVDLPILSTNGNNDLKRSEFKTLLDECSYLRNRISHHEPIIFRSQKLDWDKLEESYRILCYLTEWMDADIKSIHKYLGSQSILDLIDDGRTLSP